MLAVAVASAQRVVVVLLLLLLPVVTVLWVLKALWQIQLPQGR
jgi:hypothetical protein